MTKIPADLKQAFTTVSIVAEACSKELKNCFKPGVRVTIILRGPEGENVFATSEEPDILDVIPTIEYFAAKGAV